MKLTGPLLADIYLGKITKWNEGAITAINPDPKPPNLAIAPVQRADGSGTTFVFTDYLSRSSDIVAGTVRQITGGIGYVESAYADQNKLTTALLLNKAGKFVAPTMAAIEAAAASADWSSVQNFAIDLNDQPENESWPIASATSVLRPTSPKDVKQSVAIKKFFDWGFEHGSDIAVQHYYTSHCRTTCTTPSALLGKCPASEELGRRRTTQFIGWLSLALDNLTLPGVVCDGKGGKLCFLTVRSCGRRAVAWWDPTTVHNLLTRGAA